MRPFLGAMSLYLSFSFRQFSPLLFSFFWLVPGFVYGDCISTDELSLYYQTYLSSMYKGFLEQKASQPFFDITTSYAGH
jgi:hypothetical protein